MGWERGLEGGGGGTLRCLGKGSNRFYIEVT